MPLTQELGRFAAGLTFEKLPAEAVEIARTGMTDTVATMIAGAHDPAPQLLRKGLDPAPGPASLYFSGETATAPEAAWINGTAGHALDYDDVACRGHVSTVLVPAILAEAETLGLGGREMFAAYVAGYETWAELARRPEVQELMRRVAVVTNENYDPEAIGGSVWDQVTVDLVNGERVESEQIRRARGHAERPLGEAELFDKFRTCLDAGHARISPERLFDRLRQLERLSARELTALG
jgi:2-methylcitrate dehydratase PrpD